MEPHLIPIPELTDIVEPAPHYVRSSPTSKAAAQAKVGKTASARARVLGRIKLAGIIGCTDEQIQQAEGMSGDTERPRRVELLRAGLIMQRGERYTNSGRLAAVWVAV